MVVGADVDDKGQSVVVYEYKKEDGIGLNTSRRIIRIV